VPKTNMCKREVPHAQIGRLLAGAAAMKKGSATEHIAASLGCSMNTARSRIRHPGDLKVSELTRLAKDLEIPIAELREAIRY